MRNSTEEMYRIYKARKTWLEKMIVQIQCMDLFKEENKTKIITGLVQERDHIQSKIDNLLW